MFAFRMFAYRGAQPLPPNAPFPGSSEPFTISLTYLGSELSNVYDSRPRIPVCAMKPGWFPIPPRAPISSPCVAVITAVGVGSSWSSSRLGLL